MLIARTVGMGRSSASILRRGLVMRPELSLWNAAVMGSKARFVHSFRVDVFTTGKFGDGIMIIFVLYF